MSLRRWLRRNSGRSISGRATIIMRICTFLSTPFLLSSVFSPSLSYSTFTSPRSIPSPLLSSPLLSFSSSPLLSFSSFPLLFSPLLLFLSSLFVPVRFFLFLPFLLILFFFSLFSLSPPSLPLWIISLFRFGPSTAVLFLFLRPFYRTTPGDVDDTLVQALEDGEKSLSTAVPTKHAVHQNVVNIYLNEVRG